MKQHKQVSNNMQASENSNLNSMGNSNEFEGVHTRNEAWAVGERDSHKLYNKILKKGILENGFRYTEIIETPHGTLYIGNF